MACGGAPRGKIFPGVNIRESRYFLDGLRIKILQAEMQGEEIVLVQNKSSRVVWPRLGSGGKRLTGVGRDENAAGGWSARKGFIKAAIDPVGAWCATSNAYRATLFLST